MLEITIDEIAEIKNLVEKQKKASIKWVSTITGVEKEKIIENIVVLGLVIEGDSIRIPLTSDERGIKIIFDDAKIELDTEQSNETPQNPHMIERRTLDLDSDSPEFILSDEFSPTLKDALRFCRLEIIFIFYGLVIISTVTLLILGFTQIFLYTVLSASCFVLFWLLLGMGIVFSNRLIITDNEVIIRNFFTKKEFLIEEITDIVIYKKHLGNPTTGEQIEKKEFINFRTTNDTYTFNMKFFSERNLPEIRDEIIAFIKIKAKEKSNAISVLD